ncbi:hypothetical protein GO594_24965, partial [Pseudomonas otitidis]
MPRYLFFTLLLTCSPSGFAAYGYDYLWEILTPAGWGAVVASPAAGCHLADGTNKYGQTFIYRGYRFFRPDAVECIHTYITPEGVNRGEGAWVSLWVYRFGDGCTGGTIYNPATHICVTPEPAVGSLCQDQGGAPANNPLLKQVDGSCKPLSQSPSQKGFEPAQSCNVNVGNPISVDSGNKFQVETDLSGNHDSPIELKRFYNSIDGLWRHSFSASLSAGTKFAILTLPDGKEIYFQVTDGEAQVTRSGAGSLTRSNGIWEYTALDNRRFGFDGQGRLSYLVLPTGRQIKLSHKESSIILEDETGRSVELVEDSQHQPIAIKSNDLTVSYTYDNLSRLVKTIRLLNGQSSERHYHYSTAPASRLLTGITDERGIRYATWTYDDQGRAISSEHAGGAEKVTVAYNADGSST